MSKVDFEEFRKLVLRDELLQERIRKTADRDQFIDSVVEIGGEHGFLFTRGEVEEAMRLNHQSWLERWI